MNELKSLSPEILLHIAKSLSVPMKGLVATIELLDEGGSVPFIARYRKEATGNLDEVQIRGIEELLLYFRELQDRKSSILASIQEQGKLTGELKARIEATLEKSELEDLYLPFKPKRRTKATIAREKGFDPLAQYLWAQQPAGMPLEAYAATFGNAAEALEGARHIVAETISEDAAIRQSLRRIMFEEGVVVSHKIDGAPDEQEKFKMYYDYREPVKSIPSHRMLAIRRGETESVLHFTIELDPLRPAREIASKVHKQE
jgi:protein Tex